MCRPACRRRHCLAHPNQGRRAEIGALGRFPESAYTLLYSAIKQNEVPSGGGKFSFVLSLAPCRARRKERHVVPTDRSRLASLGLPRSVHLTPDLQRLVHVEPPLLIHIQFQRHERRSVRRSKAPASMASAARLLTPVMGLRSLRVDATVPVSSIAKQS